MLNEGQFAGTGGWVLKPDGFRSKSPVVEKSKAFAAPDKKMNLKIEVFAAQDIPTREDSRPDRLHP